MAFCREIMQNPLNLKVIEKLKARIPKRKKRSLEEDLEIIAKLKAELPVRESHDGFYPTGAHYCDDPNLPRGEGQTWRWENTYKCGGRLIDGQPVRICKACPKYDSRIEDYRPRYAEGVIIPIDFSGKPEGPRPSEKVA